MILFSLWLFSVLKFSGGEIVWSLPEEAETWGVWLHYWADFLLESCDIYVGSVEKLLGMEDLFSFFFLNNVKEIQSVIWYRNGVKIFTWFWVKLTESIFCFVYFSFPSLKICGIVMKQSACLVSLRNEVWGLTSDDTYELGSVTKLRNFSGNFWKHYWWTVCNWEYLIREKLVYVFPKRRKFEKEVQFRCRY